MLIYNFVSYIPYMYQLTGIRTGTCTVGIPICRYTGRNSYAVPYMLSHMSQEIGIPTLQIPYFCIQGGVAEGHGGFLCHDMRCAAASNGKLRAAAAAASRVFHPLVQTRVPALF